MTSFLSDGWRRKMVSGVVAAMLFLWIVPSSQAVVIDHTKVDAVAKLPQSTMDAIGKQRWFFSHASVGGNMLKGMAALRKADPKRYQLKASSVKFNKDESRADDPGTTEAGIIYDCMRGNPGPSAKCEIFAKSVDRPTGWHAGAVDIVMDKLCYVDQTASAKEYLSSMSKLEEEYPGTVFVYTTLPLKTQEDANNILRNKFNIAVREHALKNNKLLFDIADIQSHAPDGTPATFESGGVKYQKLYAAYTTDGGHLNVAESQQRIAMGWYATAAAIVSDRAKSKAEPAQE